MNKKIWIALAALVVVLIAVLVILKIAAPGETTESGDTESLYPYSYQETAKGTVLRITGKFPEGYTWAASGDEQYVTVTEKKQNAGKAEFLLTGVKSGAAAVIFTLQKEDVLPDCVYEITCNVQVAPDKTVTKNSNFHRALKGLQGGASDTFSYLFSTLPDGTVKVYLKDESGNTWKNESRRDVVSIASAQGEAAGTYYTLSCNDLGSDTVYLCCAATGEAVRLDVATDLLGRVDVIAHEITLYQQGTTGGIGYDRDYQKLVGATPLPEGVQVNEMGTTYWVSRSDNVTSFTVGFIKLTLNGQTWTLYASDLAKIEDLAGDCAANAKEQRTVTAGALEAQAYAISGGAAAAWTADGVNYVLRGESVTLETLISAAEACMGAMGNG